MISGRPRNWRVVALSTLVALMLACARDAPSASETTAAPESAAKLDLGIRLTDGGWLELADLRGTPVLLFVFATFDAASQASLKSLRPFISKHPEIIVVGVAAQPRAIQLVEAWAYALDPPFPVGADPYGSVENGQSVLGRIDTVPTFLLYDADGRQAGRTTGLLSENDLEELVDTLEPSAN